MKNYIFYLFLFISVFSIKGQSINKPNVIIFYVDDLGWQDTNLNDLGDSVPWLTPKMEALAADGAKFSQAYSPAPTCAPSRAAMLSGRHPIKTKLTQVSGGAIPGLKAAKAHNKLIGPYVPLRLDVNEFTIAEALSANGYHTGHVGKWHIEGANGFPVATDQGFDTKFTDRGVAQNMGDRYDISNFGGNDSNYPLDADNIPYDSVTDEAVGYLEDRVAANGGSGEPFFLYMATWLVHTPIQTRDLPMLQAITANLVASGQILAADVGPNGIPTSTTPLTASGEYNPFYGAMVQTVDWSLGKIVDYLKATNDPRHPGKTLYETTYIIFSSDNGASEQNNAANGFEVVADNFPLDQGKTSSREGGIRVPMIVTGPDIQVATYSNVVNGLDFFPTILSLTGTTIAANLSDDFDGADLSPLLKGDETIVEQTINGVTSERTDLFWHYPNADDDKSKSSIRRGNYKLYKHYVDDSYHAFQLYNGGDNLIDVNEATDVIDTMPTSIKDDMIAALEAYLTDNGARFPTWNPDYAEVDGPLANQDKVPSVSSTNYDQSSQIITATISTDSGQAAIAKATLLYLEDEVKEEWLESNVALTIDNNIITANVPVTATKVVFNMIDDNNFLVLSDEITTVPGAIVEPITLNSLETVQLINPATTYSELLAGTTVNGGDTYLQTITASGGGAKYLVKSEANKTITCSKITFGIRSKVDDVVAFNVIVGGVTQTFNYNSTSSTEDVEFNFTGPIIFTDASKEIEFITTSLTNAGTTPRLRLYDVTFHISEVTNNESNSSAIQYSFPTSVNGSEVLNVDEEVDVLYESSIANPNTTNPVSSPNTETLVSSILPDSKNKRMLLGFPTPVFPGANFSFSMKMYSENPGTNGTGSGRIAIRLFNSTLGTGGDDRIEIIASNKIGAEWQIISFSSSSISESTNGTITCAGGYDSMLILATNGASTVERLYFDDLEGTIENPGDGEVAISDTPTLVSGNSWIYDNDSSNLNATVSTFGSGSSIEESAATPSISNNKSTTVLKHTRGTSRNAGVTFVGSDFNYLNAKNIKFRVFAECDSDSDPKLALRLRKSGENNSDTELISETLTMIPNQWNEITVDMSAVAPDVAPAANNFYDTVILFFNTDDEATTSGNIYYVDALQLKTGAANTWNGATDSIWTTASNWSLGTAPASSDNIIIPTGLTNYPTITTAVSVNSISIEDEASLVFTGSGSLTSATNVKYKRTINGGSWYLMSSPVIGENYDDTWVAENGITSGQNNNRGISFFDNSSSDNQTGYWRYYQSNASATTFNKAQGYGIIRSTAGPVTFTGSGFYSDSQTTSITQGENNFNLVSNPFTGYLNLGDFFADNSTSNLLEANSIWIWNRNGSYDTKLSAIHSNYEIAHGQAFFVAAGTLGGTDNLTFDINDVSHQSGSDTFQKNSNTSSSIKITISDENSNTRNAEIYFLEGVTTGYDNGYDGELFSGVSQSFALFSELLDDNGKKYQIQSIPSSLIESSTVSLGLTAKSNTKITFSAETLNIPPGVNVYLEDRFKNTFTLLNEEDSKYEVTSENELNGFGRFYLKTSSKSLSTNTYEDLGKVQIYKTSHNTLRIIGLTQRNTNVKLFNVIGKQVLKSSFISKGNKEISLPVLAKGVYIAQLETENGKINKKIIF